MQKVSGTSDHKSELVAALICGRWRMPILRTLARHPHRFGELRRAIPGVTHKVLTQQLRQLEKAELVTRRMLVGTPPGVEYSIPAKAMHLMTILQDLDAWGSEHLPEVKGFDGTP